MSIWQITKHRESIFEPIKTQRVTRWPSFYLILLKDPKGHYFSPAICRSRAENDRQPAYDPLYFHLLFPRDELGWHRAVRYHGKATSHVNSSVSCRELAAYRLYIGAKKYSLLQRAARLFLSEVSTITTEMRLPSLPGSPEINRLIVVIVIVIIIIIIITVVIL